MRVLLQAVGAASLVGACASSAPARSGNVESAAERIAEAYRNITTYRDTGSVVETTPGDATGRRRGLVFETRWRAPNELFFRAIDETKHSSWVVESRDGTTWIRRSGSSPERIDSLELALVALAGVTDTTSAVVPLLLCGDPRALGEGLVVENGVYKGTDVLRLTGRTRQGAPVVTLVNAHTLMIMKQSRTLWHVYKDADGHEQKTTLLDETECVVNGERGSEAAQERPAQ